MPSHLSAIGFPIQSAEEFHQLANQIGPHTTGIRTPNGIYYHWTSDSGAELWLQVDSEDQNLIGMNPGFAGQAITTVKLTARVIDEQATPLDGAFHAWAAPEDEGTEGAYPFVFDLPDFVCHADLELPVTLQAHIAAFAHEIEVYDSEEDYNAKSTEGLKLAPQSFIPSGLFSPDGGSTEPPQAYAIFAGRIVDSGERFNDFTGARFLWAQVDSYGGSYDVVIDPELCNSVPPIGGILRGSFWLTGRLIT